MGGKPPKLADPPAPIPPVSEKSADVGFANLEAKRQAAKRKGLNSTLLAGETGGSLGASPYATPLAGKTLLG